MDGTEKGSGNIDDAAMQMGLGRKTIMYHQMSTILVEGSPNLMAALGAGTPDVSEGGVAAAEQAGIKMDTADEVYGWVDPKELDINPNFDMLGQIVYQVGEASKSAIDWLLSIKGVAAGAAASDAKVSPDGLATFAAGSNTTAGAIIVTEMRAFGLTKGVLADDELLQICAELDDKGTATADNIWLVAVRLWFTRRLESARGVREMT